MYTFVYICYIIVFVHVNNVKYVVRCTMYNYYNMCTVATVATVSIYTLLHYPGTYVCTCMYVHLCTCTRMYVQCAYTFTYAYII